MDSGPYLCSVVSHTGGLERASTTKGAIQRIARATAIYPSLCLVILLAALVINVVGYCSRRKKHFYFFASGILFIISGLFIILSLVTYAATTNAIAEGWPSVIQASPAEIKYQYGWSFLCCGCSLVLSEAAGVFALYFFLARSRHIYRKDLNQKLEDDKTSPKLKAPVHTLNSNQSRDWQLARVTGAIPPPRDTEMTDLCCTMRTSPDYSFNLGISKQLMPKSFTSTFPANGIKVSRTASLYRPHICTAPAPPPQHATLPHQYTHMLPPNTIPGHRLSHHRSVASLGSSADFYNNGMLPTSTTIM